jgi:hypothetical protein
MEPMAAKIRLKIPVGSRTGAGWKPDGGRTEAGGGIFQLVSARIPKLPALSTKEESALWNVRRDSQLSGFVMTLLLPFLLFHPLFCPFLDPFKRLQTPSNPTNFPDHLFPRKWLWMT